MTRLPNRLLPLLVGLCLFGASCGTEATLSADTSEAAEQAETSEVAEMSEVAETSTPDPSGDGVLDCSDDQVPTATAVALRGVSDAAVAETALADYLERGAALVAFPPDDSWMAVDGGRDVAMVYPVRLEGGGWEVDAILSCGPAPPPEAEPNGAIDCDDETAWSAIGEIAQDAEGHPSPEAALGEALQRFIDRFGGEIAMIETPGVEQGSGAARASLVIDGAERVVANALEFRPGRWAVDSYSGCTDYRLD